MNEVRILILSPFTYIYGIKNKYFVCGDMFYLNPSSSLEDLEELKFLLDSYQKKGWVYIEEAIVKDYSNNLGVFSQKVDSDSISEDSSSVIPEPEEIQEIIGLNQPEEVIKPQVLDLKALRQKELVQLHWRELKKIVSSLGLDYLDKETAIVEILNKEFA